jgi:formiminoglutamase
VRAVTHGAQVRAMDITEIDPQLDSRDERTVRLAALLVLEALAGLLRRQ